MGPLETRSKPSLVLTVTFCFFGTKRVPKDAKKKPKSRGRKLRDTVHDWPCRHKLASKGIRAGKCSK